MQFVRKRRRQPFINIISLIDILTVLLIDQTPVDVDKLGDLLKSKKAANSDFKLAMKCDQSAPFKIVVKVMDACNEAGITNISTYMNTKAGANP
jgi:biopolymer transport protein ExbD